MRFYWKGVSAAAGTEAGKAKILRSVTFPKTMDVYNFCSDELKKSLDAGRDFETKLLEEEDSKRGGTNKTGEVEQKKEASEDVEMKEETKEDIKVYIDHTGKRLVGEAAKAAEKSDRERAHDRKLYRPHGTGLDTGAYELIGVVTHKGRSAEGGHYIGWVHAQGDDWIQCDDDICTVVKSEDILALRGGGDWHTAYINIYRKLEITRETEEEKKM